MIAISRETAQDVTIFFLATFALLHTIVHLIEGWRRRR